VEIYTYGTQYWMLIVAYAISIPIASYIFIPVFYRLRITSVFEASTYSLPRLRKLVSVIKRYISVHVYEFKQLTYCVLF
jgi:hypothetical protein